MEEEILFSYVGLEKEGGKWALSGNHFKDVGGYPSWGQL